MRRWLASPWIAAAAGAIVFLNTLPNDFVYDDTAIVRDNPRIRALTDFRAIWFSDWWGPHNAGDAERVEQRRDRLYRPLTVFSFALNRAILGAPPIGFHTVNILLHALCCWLVWRLSERLVGDRGIAMAAALVFAVHPVHCEAVAGIVGRAEILAAIFLSLGLLVLRPPAAKVTTARVFTACGLFFLALLAKETAVCYFALAVLVLIADSGSRRWGLHFAILALPLAAYLPLRYFALDQHLLRDQEIDPLFNPVALAAGTSRVAAAFTLLGHYTRLLLVPDRLSCDYGLAVIDPDAGPTGMTLLGVVAAIGGAAALIGFRRPAGTGRVVALLSGLLIASYALVSNTVLLIGVAVGERLMYWPSVPAIILLVTLAITAWRRFTLPQQPLSGLRRVLQIGAMALVGVLGVRTMTRNLDWADNRALFTADAAAMPQSAILNRSLARELLRELDGATLPPDRHAALARSAELVRRAIAIYPADAVATQLLAELCAEMGDVPAARRYAETVLALRPNDGAAKALLARLGGGDATERIDSLRRNIASRPSDGGLRLELGRLLLQGGQHRSALVEAREAVRLAPDDATARMLLGELLALTEQEEAAVVEFSEAARLAPQMWEAHANLANLLARSAPAESLIHAERAFDLNPSDVRTHINLAEALAINGRTGEALERYRQIEKGLAPDDPYKAVAARRVRDLAAKLP